MVMSIAKSQLKRKDFLQMEAIFYGKNGRNVEAEKFVYFNNCSATW